MYLNLISKKISFPCKVVVLYLDLNIPINNKNEIEDETKIINSLPVIQFLIESFTKTIIISHYENKETKSKYPIYKRFKELLWEYNIYFSNKRKDELKKTVSNLEDGEVIFIDNCFLDNNKDILKEYSELSNIFINDLLKKVYIFEKDSTKEIKV